MKYVCITIGGFYVHFVFNGGLIDTANVQGHGPGDGSIFRRTELGNGQVTLALSGARFLSMLPDGSVAVGPEGPHSRLTEVSWPNDQISLRSPSGFFLCAERGGGDLLVANRLEVGPWERFFYEQPPAELLPQDPPATATRTLGKRKRRPPIDVARTVDQADPTRSGIRLDP